MYCKIALKNIKKSFKDYNIYFFTLILSVCIFYSFNSIDSQKALIELSSSDAEYVSKLIDFMSYISVLVAIILSFLIIYANNFLIKKRKKEIGIYTILGMSSKKISRILMFETFIVGTISLVIGVLAGIGSSQILSNFTLKLFGISMEEYKFTISITSIKKTILYFGIMFLSVILLNIFLISKYKVIDLLTAGKKNENLKIKNHYMFLGIFILSLILLAFSYKNILTIGFDPENFTFKISIICAIFCTLLFFFSLSGFILYLVRKSKKIYFKDLNIFILNQLNNKVRTNFLSMSLICIMLFITLVVLSLGISFKNSFENQLEKLTPFDASIVLRTNDTNYDIKDFLNKIDFKKDENELYASYYKYTSKIKISDLFNPNKNESADKYFVDFIKLSDYNKMLELQGKNNIVLNDNEVIIFSNRIDLAKSINQYLNDSNKISIQNKEYLVNNKKALETNLETYPVINLNCTIIINDDFIPSHDIYESVLNVKYLDNNREEKNEKYSKINNDYIHGQYKEFNSNKIGAYLKDNIYSKSKGAATTILFIGIYLGIIFLIASMAILALQQLSEASDSIERYKSLKKIGASNKMINKTIFTQILIYFSLPLILALVHSCIGIIVSNDYIRKFNQADVSFSIWFTVASFFIVYIGYFFITYIGYKNIVKNNI